uniref:CKLF like MARVEL transmembrane domain containing 5 n=1 Tax=Canis lupus familiaris TaxID=9615 RepID=A0A8I3MMF1_CANLF
MLSARDRRDGAPAEGAAVGLQGFAVDKTFLSSLKGILLETELALTFIIFICFTASISAYMAAALLEFFITLAFLFLYATQYYQHFDRLNWPCLDFLRCISAIIIFLVVSFAAVTSRDGAAIAAFVFGIILLILQLPHPGLQLLQLLLATLEGDLLSLIQPMLQVLDGLLHVLLHALQICDFGGQHQPVMTPSQGSVSDSHD